MIINVISLAVNYSTASLLLSSTSLSHAGLALSTSTVAIFGALALFMILRTRIGGMYGRSLAATIGKISVASAVMGGAVWISSRAVQHWIDIGRLERLVDLGTYIPIGLVM